MNTLILDCSCGMSIYLICDDNIVSHIDNNQKRHTDELLLSVDNLLKEANISVKEINNICVCIGPGSFTGIRVAVSICKGLAIGTGAKIFVANNFETASYKNTEKSIYILDGFSDYVYVRIDNLEKTFDSCEKINDVIEKIKSNYKDYKIYIQSEKVQNLLNNSEISAQFIKNHTVEVFKDKISENLYTNINQISPIYLRASQAEIEREEKLKRNLI